MLAARWRGASRALVTLLTAVAVTAAVLGSASAQDQDSEQSARLSVTAMTGVIGPAVAPTEEAPAEDLRLRVLVENDGETTLDNLSVVVETYRSVSARVTLRNALDDGDLPGGASTVTPVDVRPGGELAAGDVAVVGVRVAGQRAGWLGTDGIFPVKISVVRGTDVLDSVTTAVIHLDTLGVPLPSAVVWPVLAPSQRGPDGSYPVGTDALTETAGDLDARLSALERIQPPPLTLAVDAASLEELADRATGFRREDGTFTPDTDPAAIASARLLDRLADVARNGEHDPVVGPYAGVDVAALASGPADIAELAVVAMTTARTRAQQLLGRAPDLQTYLATTALTPQSLDVLPVDHVLLPYVQIQGPAPESNENLPPASRSLQSSASRQVNATVADPYLSAIMAAADDDHGALLAGQRLLVETAMIHLQAPQDPERVLLVLPEQGWSPSPLTALEQAQALTNAPWLDLRAPSELDQVTRPEPAALANAAASLPSSFVAELGTARRLLEALQAAMPNPSIDGRSPGDLSDALLRSATPEALAQSSTTALARIRRVTELVQEEFGVVDVPDGRRVTLTSDTGEVPITLQRREGREIRVVVEVDSVGRLTWDNQTRTQEVTLPAGATRTLSFTTRAVSRGTFPVTVSVWDPTRTRLLDSATLSVRATALSTPALLGTVIVVVILLGLGARRRRRPSLEVVQ